MENQGNVWCSLLTNLEDHCEQVLNRKIENNATNNNGISPSPLEAYLGGEVPAPSPLRLRPRNSSANGEDVFRDAARSPVPNPADLLLSPPTEEANVALDYVSTEKKPRTLGFRSWMKYALRSIGKSNKSAVASPKYIQAAIQIASSLTDQLIHAEKLVQYEISDEVDLLPTGTEWADHIAICLKEDSTNEDESKNQKGGNGELWLPLVQNADAEIDTASTKGAPTASDINKEFESFLDSFPKDNPESPKVAEVGKLSDGDAYSSLLSISPPSKKSFPVIDSVYKEECNYLNVEWAEVRCSKDAGVLNESNKMIFYLGLVFYELFSGEAPSPELLDLDSSNEASVTLPTLTETSSENEDDCLSQQKRRKHGSSGRDLGLNHSPLQYINLMELPRSICRLILNMLDSIHGDIAGEESYTKLTDVAFDLKLMKEKPFKFLQDLDMDRLSLSGLQLDDNIIPRESELDSIKCSYRRHVLGSRELVVIIGESGLGKSWLAQSVGKFVVSKGGVFITGKFDQLQQSRPFSALVSAFGQYCDILIKEKHSTWVKGVFDQLKATLGQDVRYLITLIPKLGEVVGCASSGNAFQLDQNCVHTKAKMHYLLTQFVRAISMNSPFPIAICIEDMQWADEASTSVIDLLLRRQHNIFFLWSCRDDELKSNSSQTSQLIRNGRIAGVNVDIVTLKCMEQEELNRIMSEILCLPPRIVKSLSIVAYKKTKGNTLFFCQLLLSLNRNGLIRLDYDTKRWVWDEDKIYSMKLPENVALCFGNGIKKLSPEVQLALSALSMFGASVRISYIEELEKHLHLNLTEPLKIAAAEGLVNHHEGFVQFAHDRIQEVVYGMVEQSTRSHYHYSYGVILCSQAAEDIDMMFIGVNQINLGGPSAVLNPDDFITMTKFNLVAGKKAMEMSGFASAFNFFFCGIKFLPANHWTEHYHLSLELFELASKAALVSGNRSSFDTLSEEVLSRANCFEDKLNINYLIMSSLVYTPKIVDALEIGRVICSRLGQDIPTNPSGENLNAHIASTQALIKGLSEDDLLDYRPMADPLKLLTMRFLAKMESIAVLIKPELHPYITLNMVELTISHGLSPTAPIVFVSFGSLLAKAGSIRVGSRFALMSYRLLEKLDVKEIAGEVIAAVTEVQCFVEPILATNELRAQGEHAAIIAGDVYFGCICRLHYCLVLLWAGLNLNFVEESLSKAIQYNKDQDEDTCLMIAIIAHRTVMTLIGKEHEVPSESEVSDIIRGKGSRPRQLIIFSFNNLYIAYFLSNDVAVVKRYAQRFLEHKKKTSYILFSDTMHAFILGLAAFWISREDEQQESSKWLDIGWRFTGDMKLWAEQGSEWNFQQKYSLLRAEGYYSSGNLEAAKAAYNSAITFARTHKAINDEALACELAAKFYFNAGDKETSLTYFQLAHAKYEAWGSVKKASQLYEETMQSFSDVVSLRNSDEPHTPINTNAHKRREI